MASSQSVATAPTPPQLYDTTLPASSGTCTLTVPAGGDLQAAIDELNLGDTLCLQAGATFTGNFILRNKTTGSGWLTIRTATPDDLYPPPGTRVGPSDTPQMATILTPNVGPVFITEVSANHYRLIGLELGIVSNPQPPENYILVELGDGSATSVSQAPSDIVIDRCYVHGNPTLDAKRGIQTNSARTAVIDSYVSEFHSIAQDNQAIGGWDGPGPFKIVNNFLEAAGENVLFGGALALAPELMPQDGDIEFNYFYKSPSWNPNDPSYGGIHWTVKNLLEIKDGNRFLVNGNIMENNWVDAQSGFAIFLQGLPNEDGLFAVAENIAFTNNIIGNSYAGVAFCGQCIYAPAQTTDPTAPNYADPNVQRVQEVLFENNVFDNIPGLFWSASSNLTNIRWDHNTIINPAYYAAATISAPVSTYVDFTNNIAFFDNYGFYGDDSLPFVSYLQQYIFTDNVLIDNQGTASAYANGYPSGNLFPQIDPNALFVNYNGGSGGDYHLAANSPYRGAGTDGNDLGANIDTLNSATGGVIAGIMPVTTPPVTTPPVTTPPVTTPPVTTPPVITPTPVLTVTTFSTFPRGLSFTVDGQIYTVPTLFEWNAGTTHIISVNSVETNAAGMQFIFSEWADRGAATHTITAGSTLPNIVAFFQ